MFVLICILTTVLCGCGNSKTSNETTSCDKTINQTTSSEKATDDTAQAVTTGEVGVIQDEEYGGTFIDLPIDEFNALGFDFGDSVNVSFDNGITLDDLPYYSGYYVPVDELLLCGYPGSAYVKIARNYGDSTWEEFKMTKDSKVTVTMNEKAKYLSTQEFNALEYSDDQISKIEAYVR